MASGAARLVAGPIAIAGWILVLAGLGVARWLAPIGDLSEWRFAGETLVTVEGRITEVEPARWALPPKREGLLPLQIYRVTYRFLDASDAPHDGRAYTQGLFHRVREPVTVEYVRGRPELSRIKRGLGRPFGTVPLRYLLAPLPGLLVVAIGAWRARDRTARRGAWVLPILALGLAIEVGRALWTWTGG